MIVAASALIEFSENSNVKPSGVGKTHLWLIQLIVIAHIKNQLLMDLIAYAIIAAFRCIGCPILLLGASDGAAYPRAP
jgi:hypothetical protein